LFIKMQLTLLSPVLPVMFDGMLFKITLA